MSNPYALKEYLLLEYDDHIRVYYRVFGAEPGSIDVYTREFDDLPDYIKESYALLSIALSTVDVEGMWHSDEVFIENVGRARKNGMGLEPAAEYTLNVRET